MRAELSWVMNPSVPDWLERDEGVVLAQELDRRLACLPARVRCQSRVGPLAPPRHGRSKKTSTRSLADSRQRTRALLLSRQGHDAPRSSSSGRGRRCALPAGQ
jgi:hypothetical protein